MTWIDAVVRVAAAVAALAAFYIAWFVYEDEEKKLQNTIETWWLQFDDFRSRLVSRQAAFVVVVALRANEVLDRLFGPKLLANDAIGTAASVAIGSVFVAAALGNDWRWWALAAPTFACALAPLASPRLRRLSHLPAYLFFPLAVAVVLLVGLGAASSPGQSGHVWLSLPVAIGIALTLFQVTVTRQTMRLTVAAQSEWPIVGGMVVVALPLALGLAILPDLDESSDVAIIIRMVVGSGLASIALFGLLAAFATVMLLHRLAWPLASRLLYALGPRYRLVQNKTALNAAGVMLAGIAITGTYGWHAILKHFGIA